VQIGDASFGFEVVPGWEQLPEGWSHPDVAGVCTDSFGRVYLFCRGDHPVIVYDAEGKYLDAWGEGRFSYRAHGMFMTPQDELLLVDDGGNTVRRYSTDGRLLQQIGPTAPPSDTGYVKGEREVTHPGGPYNRPTNAAIAASGDIYVSDGYGNCQIHRFNPDGQQVQSWGTPGPGPGQFRLPHSVWVHEDGRVFVADRQNERIQIFGPDGNYLTEWTDVQRPQDIFIDHAGRVYVAELCWRAGEIAPNRDRISEYVPARISIFDATGKLLLRWADPDPMKAGYFIAPHALWVDPVGSLYVAEATHTVAVSNGLAPASAHTFQKFARL
jgi:DNA-binding beta-propeller fold protein YncE